MANSPISPVPTNQNVIDKNGMISQIWAGFLTDLWNRAGGPIAPSNTQLAETINQIISADPNTIVGNNTGTTASAIDLTPSQVTAMLPIFTSLLKGLTPASGGGSINFLRADGQWQKPTFTVLDYFVSAIVNSASSSITSATFITASNSPAFSFVPNYTGKYKIYSSIPMSVTNATSAKGATRIFETSAIATLLNESQAVVGGPTAVVPVESSIMAQSVYSLTSGATYVFDIQAKVISGTSLIIDGANANFFMFAERVA